MMIIGCMGIQIQNKSVRSLQRKARTRLKRKMPGTRIRTMMVKSKTKTRMATTMTRTSTTSTSRRWRATRPSPLQTTVRTTGTLTQMIVMTSKSLLET
ncbi:hypothetical protein JYU34_011208 [Plutella xylostella]|uniref:Uncharacterized protein n=1 Tax=Plutella xylostella TaxID=51655 RepID=A0ABQ7QGD3_PLUXY|nr:hypothetical protein JYU34_011208 [Plutella xylostella]